MIRLLYSQQWQRGLRGMWSRKPWVRSWSPRFEHSIKGRSYLNVSLTDRSMQDVVGKKQTTGNVHKKPHMLLSPREFEVLVLLARGHTNQEIAGQLRLSAKTVGTYRTRITEKMGLKNRADIVRYALENGLLEIVD